VWNTDPDQHADEHTDEHTDGYTYGHGDGYRDANCVTDADNLPQQHSDLYDTRCSRCTLSVDDHG
jgi:hypothetical protein